MDANYFVSIIKEYYKGIKLLELERWVLQFEMIQTQEHQSEGLFEKKY